MKKTVLTITISFLVFLCVVVLKNCFSYMLPNNAFGIRYITSKEKADYLFIGSSSFRKGIDMKALENELGEDTYMLTYNGNQPMNVLVELKQMLEAGTKIDTIVYELEPGMVDRGADLSDKRLLWDIDMKSKKEIWDYLKERDDADFFMFYDYYVSSNMDYLLTYPISYPMIAKRYYKGGNNGEDVSIAKTKEELDKLPIAEDPGIDSLQKESIVNIINLCNDNGIKLIFLEPPKYIRMYEDKDFADKLGELTQFLEDVNANTILADDLGFDYTNPDYYSDLSHMSGEGMTEFTNRVIEVLK